MAKEKAKKGLRKHQGVFREEKALLLGQKEGKQNKNPLKSDEKYLNKVEKEFKSDVHKKELKKPLKILKDPVKLFYEVLFWVGLLLIVLFYFYALVFGVVVGLILIFLSLFVYELHHKEEEEKKKKGKVLTYIFLIVVIAAIVYFLYSSRMTLIETIKAPLSENWFLYLLAGLFLMDMVLVVYHLFKSKKGKLKREKEAKPMVAKVEHKAFFSKKPKPKREDVKKIKGKIHVEKKEPMLYTALYFISLLISTIAILYKNWLTMLLGFALAGMSLVAYRHVISPHVGKKFEPKVFIVGKPGKKEQFDAKGVHERLMHIQEAEKKALEEGLREEKMLKELQKKKKQEEKLLKRKENLKRREVKARLKMEGKRRKEEKRELEKLEKAKKRLEKFEMKKQKLKKESEFLLKSKSKEGARTPLVGDIPQIKKEVNRLGKYETDFDKLYELLEKYKVIKLAEVSEIFGIKKEKSEEWAQILESHNLAIIHYPAMGGAELRKVGIKAGK